MSRICASLAFYIFATLIDKHPNTFEAKKRNKSWALRLTTHAHNLKKERVSPAYDSPILYINKSDFVYSILYILSRERVS